MRKRVRKNHKGYTLVELIVAIAILGIVVMPLLQGFISSATTNTKARKLLAATTVAENLMEEIKSKGFNQLYKEQIGTISESPDDFYTWIKKDIELDGKKYHAKVEVDGNTYKGIGSDVKYNDEELVDIYNMDTKQDAFYVESATARRAVMDHYATCVQVGKTMDVEFEKTLLREIEVTVIATGDMNGDYTTKVKLTSRYTTNSSNIDTDKLTYVEFENYTIYDSSQAQGKLRAIYLFYAPLYDIGLQKDTITITNKQEVPIRTYLIKQKKNNSMDAEEEGYRVGIHVVEKESSTSSDIKIEGDPGSAWSSDENYIASTQLQSNINWNISNVLTPLTSKQGIVKYTRLGSSVLGLAAEKVIQLSGMAPSTSKERLYNVEISIYPDVETGIETEIFATTNCIVQMDGTIGK